MPRFMHPRWGTVRVHPGVDPAAPAGLLRGHAGGGRGCRPPGLAHDRLRHPARGRADRHPVGLHDDHAEPPLFGLRPAIAPGFPGISKTLRPLGPRFWGPVGRFPAWATRSWAGPWYRLRKELGLPPWAGTRWSRATRRPWSSHCSRKCSPPSKPTGPRRPLSPASRSTTRTGTGPGLAPELVRFLDAGPPPIVFTLGYSAVTVAGRFLRTASPLPGRWVVVPSWSGRGSVEGTRLRPRASSPVTTHPFSQLFPRAAAVVHAGGIGTTGLAMRAGRPMLVVPFAHDQPDNAERLRRLGVARTIPGPRYSAPERRPSCGTCLTTRRTRSEPRRSGHRCVTKTACGSPVTPWKPCFDTDSAPLTQT